MSDHVFDPLLDVLPRTQRAVWPRLRASVDLGLVLYGGTAIALQLGHRTSVDFDFFTDAQLDKNRIHHVFDFMGSALLLQDGMNTLTVMIPSETAEDPPVNVSFFGGIAIGRVGHPRLSSDRVAAVASLDDLMATKLKVLLQRVEAKDYIDVAALIEQGVALSRGLAAARLMYGSAFQPCEALKAMTYFEGGDLETLSVRIREGLIAAARQIGDLPEIALTSRRLADAWPTE